ncbi:hypothetical protein FACS1894191_2400 [Clostridia bacterium]|nr:hypothetical protein FACS1894191_2400 [Clostridia bacterium]
MSVYSEGHGEKQSVFGRIGAFNFMLRDMGFQMWLIHYILGGYANKAQVYTRALFAIQIGLKI